jgi:hypothetical protein
LLSQEIAENIRSYVKPKRMWFKISRESHAIGSFRSLPQLAFLLIQPHRMVPPLGLRPCNVEFPTPPLITTSRCALNFLFLSITIDHFRKSLILVRWYCDWSRLNPLDCSNPLLASIGLPFIFPCLHITWCIKYALTSLFFHRGRC